MSPREHGVPPGLRIRTDPQESGGRTPIWHRGAGLGRRFVATDRRGVFRELFLLDASGRRVRMLQGDGSHFYRDPNFSPNGRWIT
jgi:hypothetical protein